MRENRAPRLFRAAVWWIIVSAYPVALILALSGCNHTCRDNPRNMSCMTADELRGQLGKGIGQ